MNNSFNLPQQPSQFMIYGSDNNYGDSNNFSFNEENLTISETPTPTSATFSDHHNQTSSPPSSAPSNITPTTNTRRQPRGKINKRACMNCRKLKVKCDGDALAGKDCTNCGNGKCVFDQSPRKNRQVESLNKKIDELVDKLEKTKRNFDKKIGDYDEKINTLELEKDITQSLFKCLLRFQHESALLLRLLDFVKESRSRTILVLLSNLLSRVLEEGEDLSRVTPTLERIMEFGSNNPDSYDIVALQFENEFQKISNNVFNINIIDDNNNIIHNIIHSNINNSPNLQSSPSASPSSNSNYSLHPNSNNINISTSTTPIMTTPILHPLNSFPTTNNVINSPTTSDIFTPSTSGENNEFNSPPFDIISNLYYYNYNDQ